LETTSGTGVRDPLRVYWFRPDSSTTRTVLSGSASHARDPEPLERMACAGPLRDTEKPVVRAYWLVHDIEAALDAASKQGAFVAHSPLEIPGTGTFAIYIQGEVDHGLCQLKFLG
jgi:hypothetical protein